MDIYRVELGPRDGEAHGAVPLIASSRLERHPRYSPDGKKISFVSLRTGKWQLWVCDSEGGNLQQLTSFDRGEVRRPEWSDDSRQIEFKANPDGAFRYYAIDAAGGAPRQIDISAASIRARLSDVTQIAPSLDGRFLYFARTGSIWRVPAHGEINSAVKVFSLDGIIPEEGLAVDRRGIYFVTNFSSSLQPGQMMFYRFFDGRISKVTGADDPSYYGSSVSPDGRYLLYTKFTATGSDLMLVENFH
jgi:Tol biopolymer transport system component